MEIQQIADAVGVDADVAEGIGMLACTPRTSSLILMPPVAELLDQGNTGLFPRYFPYKLDLVIRISSPIHRKISSWSHTRP
jgi:hypothetical protein